MKEEERKVVGRGVSNGETRKRGEYENPEKLIDLFMTKPEGKKEMGKLGRRKMSSLGQTRKMS